MTIGLFEQRNPYKGTPARPWIRLRLQALDGTTQEVELLADTGNPYALILSQPLLAKFKQGDAPDVNTNFGVLIGGWLHVQMPELSLDHYLVGYGSDAVVGATKASSPDFEGLAGLPFLRMVEYGGDADWFWVRSRQSQP